MTAEMKDSKQDWKMKLEKSPKSRAKQQRFKKQKGEII